MNRKGKRLLLMGALLIPEVFALLLGTLAGTKDPGFQALPAPKLQWAFITREGGELSEYGCLLPDPRRLEKLTGVPVEATVCTADKFMNLIAANKAVESCRQIQVVRIVVSTPQSEVEQIYRETLLEMENRGHDLMVQWKQNKYRQAMLLVTE